MQGKTSKLYIAVSVALAGLLVFYAVNPLAGATHQPADKLAVAGSTMEVMDTITEGSKSEVYTILTGTMKTSSPTDLVIAVTAECALWTDLRVDKNTEAGAIATVKMWVEIDGEPVPVTAGDDGQVVFCNREYRMKITTDIEESLTIETFLRSRQANAFNWITTNVGSGVHEIVVKAQLSEEVNGSGSAAAAVGKRTLVVTPVKLANDVTI